MGLFVQINVPILLPVEVAPVRTVQKAGWAAQLVRTDVENRETLAATSFRTPTVQPVASRNTDYTIPINLH
jgi:hypothetical protein